MFEKKIKFICSEKFKDFSNLEFPKPIKLNIPAWYKDLNHTHDRQTVKGCMPFLDTLTLGYSIPMIQDIHFKIHFNKEKNCWDGNMNPDSSLYSDLVDIYQLNINKSQLEVHPTWQWENAPWTEQNYNLPAVKIINPWIIKTPPGYSCLFVSPLNNKNDKIELIAGIVDTDTFPHQVNFPCFFNYYKYPEGIDFVLEKGTSIVQVIPFKRDSWKMEIDYFKVENMRLSYLNYTLGRFRRYKNKIWNKKICN